MDILKSSFFESSKKNYKKDVGNNLIGEQTLPWMAVTRWSGIYFNPLTPVSEQERISPYSVNAKLSRQVIRV